MLKRLLSAISLAVVVLAAQAASAGVTIHYEGTAKDLPSARRAIEAARAEARKLGWVVQDANQATVTILRVIGEAEKPYTGPLTGVVIRPHPNCDPLFLQFGSDLYLQDFVKTQFAGPDTHIAIVGLLKTLQPFFRSLAPHLHGATLSHDRSPLWASSPLFLAADSFGLRRETGLLIPSRFARR